MGPGHPERPERLRAIQRGLEQPRFDLLTRMSAPRGAPDILQRIHPPSYLTALEQAAPREGYSALDSDTLMCPRTVEAVWHAAGGAVAARHAQAAHGAERVAIVDFDVHHGNGTQEIFWAEDTVLFCSTHQAPFYPGTGGRNETGAHDNIVNAPLFAGSTGDAFHEAFADRILPRLRAFAPDLILISAGFDAHERDPLGGLRLREVDFGDATKRIMEIADQRCGGRVVSMLEGGYDVDALSSSVNAHVLALMGVQGHASP